MQNLSKSNYFIVGVVAAWFILVVTGLVYFQLGQLKPFDESQMLKQQNWFEQFKQQLVVSNTVASLVIITEQNCGCTKQAQAHITTLQAFAKSKGLAVPRYS